MFQGKSATKRTVYDDDDDRRPLLTKAHAPLIWIPLWGILFEGVVGGGFNTVNQLLHLALR